VRSGARDEPAARRPALPLTVGAVLVAALTALSGRCDSGHLHGPDGALRLVPPAEVLEGAR
jgi:hypothetical protein